MRVCLHHKSVLVAIWLTWHPRIQKGDLILLALDRLSMVMLCS